MCVYSPLAGGVFERRLGGQATRLAAEDLEAELLCCVAEAEGVPDVGGAAAVQVGPMSGVLRLDKRGGDLGFAESVGAPEGAAGLDDVWYVACIILVVVVALLAVAEDGGARGDRVQHVVDGVVDGVVSDAMAAGTTRAGDLVAQVIAQPVDGLVVELFECL